MFAAENIFPSRIPLHSTCKKPVGRASGNFLLLPLAGKNASACKDRS